MKRFVTIVAVLGCAVAAEAATKRDTITRSFTTAGSAGRQLEIDNIFGSIEVVGHSGQTIEMVAEQKTSAPNDAKLAEALRDVRLDITQAGNAVKVVVDGPFRQPNGRVNWSSDRYDYEVHFDFTLKVPMETALKLKTVNSGFVRVTNVVGDFEVRNVNGRIEMKDVAGAGSATTVNGPVKASFTKLPGGAVRFKTVNGELEAVFPDGLGADVSVKTFNGETYTDFDVTTLPGKGFTADERQGQRVWRRDRAGHLRIGPGGPEMNFETLNGDIRILKRER
ncbi:MAG: hypothetical protein SFV54_05580 [Bryobacteraceae bacterium]|nr:hypothetical protein [Bryobacteraceae bacterium]